MSTASGSDIPPTSAFAVSTEQTMIAPPTETSIPPVMITTVMPTPTSAIGAVATSSGWIEPAVRNAGVDTASATQITAITPISTSSWPVTGDGRIRLRTRGRGRSAAGPGPGGSVSVLVMRRPPAPPARPLGGTLTRSCGLLLGRGDMGGVVFRTRGGGQHVDLGGIRPE